MTAERTFYIVEHKYHTLPTGLSELHSCNALILSSLDQRLYELAQVQAQKHQFHLQFIEKYEEVERLKTAVSEAHKSKRQLIEVVEPKDLEISEKLRTISIRL